jgi:hypothetical protein
LKPFFFESDTFDYVLEAVFILKWKERTTSPCCISFMEVCTCRD